MSEATPVDLAWATGIFEGEGSFGLSQRRPGQWHCHMSITMTDEDVLRRVGSILGGNVTGPLVKPSKIGYKPFWHWQLSRHDDVGTLLNLMWPWLGERRRQRATEARDLTHLTFSHKGPKKSPWVIEGMKPWKHTDVLAEALTALAAARS